MSIRQYWFVLWELTKKRIETKICQKFSGNSVELCVSVDAYGIGCGIVLDHFQ